jgi:hypothetical protein
MPNWLQFGEQKPPKKEDGVIEITPESLQKTFTDKTTELESKLTALGTAIEDHPTLKAMQEFLDTTKANRKKAADDAAAAAAANDGQRFDSLDQTTREYVDKTLRPIAQATLYQQGTEMRRNIFEDEEAFPYYVGALKSKIDALLDAQPADARANPDIIRNVYKIVIYDNNKEIAENKHKSRLSSASASGTGTGAPGTGDKAAMPVLTEQMKSVAKAMGMTEQEYAASMKELQEAGEYA